MVPFIQDFFASCPSRMVKARRSKLCNLRQVVGKLPSWRQETDWKNPKSQGFCLLLPVSPSLKSLYKENPCIKYIQSPPACRHFWVSSFCKQHWHSHFLHGQTDLDLNDQKNHTCKKLTEGMVFPFLCPTAFKDGCYCAFLTNYSSSCWSSAWERVSRLPDLSPAYISLSFEVKEGVSKCRGWAVDLIGKHKEWPNLKRRLGMSFVKLSPLLFCLWSPCSGYGWFIVLYRVKMVFINAWWKINSLYLKSWDWDVGTNLQPEVCPQLRNFGKLWQKGWNAFYNNFRGSTQSLRNNKKCFCCFVFVFFNVCTAN